MKQFLSLSIVLTILLACGDSKSPSDFDFATRFESSKGLETATYDEVIEFYSELAEAYPSVRMYEMGPTDSGKKLNLVTFNPDRTFESEFHDRAQKNILLINNGIHPGESDGIDASMIFMRDLAQGNIPAPRNTIIAVIPTYNIGGALNRNSTSRTNQNGPLEYGFRGNARNFDLNRDFIKTDTKNAGSFAYLFHVLNPDLFIDTHVSNGADYQYTLTHLFTQHNKLGGSLGNYLQSEFMTQLEDSLNSKGWPVTPYVNVYNRTPESGFSQFFDAPRYSTGYTSLFNTLGMMVETHMLKPYKLRVEGTYELLKSFTYIADKDWETIKELRKIAFSNYTPGSDYPIAWSIDSSQTRILDFKGYEATMIPSKITGVNRLKYNTNKPFTKKVNYYDYYKPDRTIKVPEKYIVPAGWFQVIWELDNNDISMKKVVEDTVITAQVYTISNYETRQRPYEGHYPHYNTEVQVSVEEVIVKKGDYIIDTDQPGVRFLLETLEPMAVDSYFNWNYFDTILQQKEGFSSYVWEDMAEDFLKNNPEIKKAFEEKKASDPAFSQNWYLQLDWIHKQSPYYETSHLRYPIVRVGG
ncbi:MAG: hypothetical protein HKO54_04880 [Flavobacteriaceae bacterium]|nr:hypothetical protein [Flavobacteriaceae bacterium]